LFRFDLGLTLYSPFSILVIQGFRSVRCVQLIAANKLCQKLSHQGTALELDLVLHQLQEHALALRTDSPQASEVNDEFQPPEVISCLFASEYEFISE
jgi:hypothetical protein